MAVDTGTAPGTGTGERLTWTNLHTLVLLTVLTGIGLAGLLVPRYSELGAWLAILGALAVCTVVTGHGVTGLWSGCMIDARNRISLARLQAILWTIVVLSAFLAGALFNIHAGGKDPLAIGVPEELWILMGISLTSLVGSPLILNRKKSEQPEAEEFVRTKEILGRQGEDVSEVHHDGKVLVKTYPMKASVSDLFRGDETGNAAQLDLVKVQMFYFTLVLGLAYCVQLGNLFFDPGESITGLPELSASMLTLFGISHAGYLVNKATPH